MVHSFSFVYVTYLWFIHLDSNDTQLLNGSLKPGNRAVTINHSSGFKFHSLESH